MTTRKVQRSVVARCFAATGNRHLEMYALALSFLVLLLMFLGQDIRNLLREWSEEIDQCERVWIRASVSNRRIFFDFEDSSLTKGDERLRTFPFPTRRPVSPSDCYRKSQGSFISCIQTQSELLRCLMELTKVKITHFTEEELKAQDEAYLASLPKPKPVPVPAQPKEN